jgi:hypothetical protein
MEKESISCGIRNKLCKRRQPDLKGAAAKLLISFAAAPLIFQYIYSIIVIIL